MDYNHYMIFKNTNFVLSVKFMLLVVTFYEN